MLGLVKVKVIIICGKLYVILVYIIMQRSLIKRIGSILPGLHNKGFKGDNGRIAVIGGSY